LGGVSTRRQISADLDRRRHLISNGLSALLQSGLAEGDYVWLKGNPFDCGVHMATLDALDAKGVMVKAECPGYY
jgi:hypothetical protein